MKTTHEVIMPALGMTQDTGVINAWLKTVGDVVSTSDVLMEVETDKTTLEVEAGFAGMVVELRAKPGVDVPVGDVVAVISSDKNAASASAKEPRAVITTAPPAEPEPVKAAEPVAPVDKPQQPAIVSSAPTPHHTDTPGRLLASPKAKFVADQRGIDLHRLILQGVSQPVHVADLDRYQAPSPNLHGSRLEAEVELTVFNEFTQWAGSHSDASVTPQLVWLLFASSAYRQSMAMTRKQSVTVQVESLLDADQGIQITDADLTGLLQLPANAVAAFPGQAVDLLVRDLTGTSIIDYQPEVPDIAPMLSINAGRGDHYRLTLQFQQAQIPLSQAVALLQGVVNRIAQPLTHLL